MDSLCVFSAVIMSETATQLALIINMLKDQSTLINETKALLAESQAKVAVLETKVSVLELTVDALSADVMSLKEQLNSRNQEGKLNNARIFGVPFSDEETKATDGGEAFKKLIYDRFVKPCLNAARANGDIPTVPHAANTIAKLYRLGKAGAPGSRPPPSSCHLLTMTSGTLCSETRKPASPSLLMRRSPSVSSGT